MGEAVLENTDVIVFIMVTLFTSKDIMMRLKPPFMIMIQIDIYRIYNAIKPYL